MSCFGMACISRNCDRPYGFFIQFHTNSLCSLLYIEATPSDAKGTATVI
jgi:hypothetical protein